jgi:hypothetical protein
VCEEKHTSGIVKLLLPPRRAGGSPYGLVFTLSYQITLCLSVQNKHGRARSGKISPFWRPDMGPNRSATVVPPVSSTSGEDTSENSAGTG